MAPGGHDDTHGWLQPQQGMKFDGSLVAATAPNGCPSSSSAARTRSHVALRHKGRELWSDRVL